MRLHSTNDLAPHTILVQVRHGLHEVLPDGKLSGTTKESGLKVIEIKGDTKVSAKLKLKAFLERLNAG